MWAEELQNQKVYTMIANQWSHERNSHFWIHELEEFYSLLPSGSWVLEIWCGSWRDARLLIEHGYDYTGYDISEAFIDIARKNVSNGKFILWDMYDTRFLEWKKFDGFWGCACFVHVPKMKIDYVIQNLIAHLNRPSVGFISIQEWDDINWVEQKLLDWTSFTRFFQYYTYSEFEEILQKNWFRVIKTMRNVNESKKWLSFFVRLDQISSNSVKRVSQNSLNILW
jgi:SAM-dependent methyltransferase